MSEKTKIQISNMDLHYGNFHALKNINMEIPEKEITAFIGPSGCGKSTLLKSLNRMNDLVEGCKITGKVELDGAGYLRRYGCESAAKKGRYGVSRNPILSL